MVNVDKFVGKEYYENSDLQEIYGKDYYKKSYEIFKKWNVKAEFIRKILSPKKLLDIGCAEGWLVSELVKLNVDAYGIDGSIYALSKVEPSLKDRFQQVNLNLDKLPFEDQTFDSISCLHTIEHIHLVEHFMKELFRVTKDSGRIWILTPSYEYVDMRTLGRSITDVNVKTPKEWESLFFDYGFIVKKQRHYGFINLKGRLAPLRLYKLPEPLQTWAKYAIQWYLDNVRQRKKKLTKEASFVLIKPELHSDVKVET
ncbi:MAG: putative Bifunctional 3-demethylubiquinone-9 3-methyltransferase/ 2-octaprenyl-6-hydroxy phenol methylase [Nitrosopumilales archaeon]|nr:MAG: putative Bifunctional 3-demethylubiquinone-9 3-methyltransferase/ 2-octaprenyl-6-hydroxy phenol methylase [Nitrosopumilales archaeon]